MHKQKNRALVVMATMAQARVFFARQAPLALPRLMDVPPAHPMHGPPQDQACVSPVPVEANPPATVVLSVKQEAFQLMAVHVNHAAKTRIPQSLAHVCVPVVVQVLKWSMMNAYDARREHFLLASVLVNLVPRANIRL